MKKQLKITQAQVETSRKIGLAHGTDAAEVFYRENGILELELAVDSSWDESARNADCWSIAARESGLPCNSDTLREVYYDSYNEGANETGHALIKSQREDEAAAPVHKWYGILLVEYRYDGSTETKTEWYTDRNERNAEYDEKERRLGRSGNPSRISKICADSDDANDFEYED